MIAIRSNFFYTRSVPCELWFLNRNKPDAHRDKVLMLDARNIYRKVTRKIYDFSPEQLQNLLAIVWLYRSESNRFLDLVAHYLKQTLNEAQACFKTEDTDGKTINPLPDFEKALADLKKAIQPFLNTHPKDAAHANVLDQLTESSRMFTDDVSAFRKASKVEQTKWEKQKWTNTTLNKAAERLQPLGQTSRDLIKQADILYKLACRLIDLCEGDLEAKKSEHWVSRDVLRGRKAADQARQVAVTQLKQVRYFHKQAVWLTDRFPKGELCNVEGWSSSCRCFYRYSGFPRRTKGEGAGRSHWTKR
jgi:type I restriction enzyme M protein